MKNHLRSDKVNLWMNVVPNLLHSCEASRVLYPPSSGDIADYKVLAWVFLATSLLFLLSFVVTAVRLMRIKKKLNNVYIYENKAPSL